MADFIAYVRDLEGETKVTIKREKIAFGPKYLVTLDNGNRFTITRAQGLLKQDLIAESDDDTLSFSGDLWKFNFQTLNKDREIVAAVRLDSHKGTDAYTLDIYDENYEKEMLGILIVVKNIIGLQRTSSMIIAST